jgi:hypothetical protein
MIRSVEINHVALPDGRASDTLVTKITGSVSGQLRGFGPHI